MTTTLKPEETEFPELHIRSESLHKASTDLTANDIVDVPKDLWVADGVVVIRADDEESAKAKATALANADVIDVKVRKATAKDLERDKIPTASSSKS